MKNVFLIKCYMGSDVKDSFMLVANESDVDDMVDNINYALSYYNSDDSDLIGHPMEKTLRDIRGVSQSNQLHDAINQYPDFGSKYFFGCDRIEKEKANIYQL